MKAPNFTEVDRHVDVSSVCRETNIRLDKNMTYGSGDALCGRDDGAGPEGRTVDSHCDSRFME